MSFVGGNRGSAGYTTQGIHSGKKAMVQPKGTTTGFMSGGGRSAQINKVEKFGPEIPTAAHPMSSPREQDRKPGQAEGTGPLKSLSNPKKFRNITYPRNADAVDHYMTISAYETRHFPAFGAPRKNTNILQRAILPMPSNLVAGYKQEYKNEALGVAGQFFGNALNTAAAQNPGSLVNAVEQNKGALAQGSAAFGAATDLAAGTISTMMDDINKGVVMAGALRLTQDQIPAVAGAATLGLGGAAIAEGAARGVQAFQAAQGRAINPHTSVIYDMPSLRAFSFQWDLRPKNYYESIQISRLVAFFKYYSAPSFEDGMSNHFFKYPNQFKLKVKHDEFLFAFGDCVLTNFEVDYHGEGTPMYYDAAGSIRAGNRRLKAPAVVKISTEWQEVSIVTKEAIEEAGR